MLLEWLLKDTRFCGTRLANLDGKDIQKNRYQVLLGSENVAHAPHLESPSANRELLAVGEPTLVTTLIGPLVPASQPITDDITHSTGRGTSTDVGLETSELTIPSGMG